MTVEGGGPAKVLIHLSRPRTKEHADGTSHGRYNGSTMPQ